MRWTGLRIGDAVTLEKSRLTLDPRSGIWSIMVYQRKTGDPVYCPIPPHVADLLLTVPPTGRRGNARYRRFGPVAASQTNDRYFFWTGNGQPRSAITGWRQAYAKLFKRADLKEPDGTPKRCHPHMLRDTYAIEALLSGMRVEEV